MVISQSNGMCTEQDRMEMSLADRDPLGTVPEGDITLMPDDKICSEIPDHSIQLSF